MNKKQVIEIVRQSLETQPLRGVTLDVVDEGVHRDGTWWYVPVRADKEQRKRWRHYEALSDIEDQIREAAHLKVLLVPSS